MRFARVTKEVSCLDIFREALLDSRHQLLRSFLAWKRDLPAWQSNGALLRGQLGELSLQLCIAGPCAKFRTACCGRRGCPIVNVSLSMRNMDLRNQSKFEVSGYGRERERDLL